jgi:hypothetical protein
MKGGLVAEGAGGEHREVAGDMYHFHITLATMYDIVVSTGS